METQGAFKSPEFKSLKRLCLTFLCVLLVVPVLAQTKTVKGVVYEEETGETMPGVLVTVSGSTRGAQTDLDGSFELSGVKPTDKLKFETLGKQTQILDVGDLSNFIVKMKNAANELDEVTVVAFGKQRKESVIGSITAIDVETLKVPSSNLTTALAGNVAGVIAYQRSGEPGQDNVDFFVRGITTFNEAGANPLILIDNIELTSTDLARLQPDDIESFSIMKDATATALYGARGANGVIFVTTKRGQEGPAKIFARVETSISRPTDVIRLADPITYMKSYNEAITTRDPLGELMYSFDKIEQTGKPGANPYIYPMNDWYDMLFKDYATSYRANLSARGGGKVATYYVAGAFTEDTGILKVDKRNSFNNNIDSKTYTLRSNVDINITPTTKLAVRLTGNFSDYQGPLQGGNQVYRDVVHSDPVLFPAYYPQDEDHVGIKHIMFGNYEDGYINPYANLVRGYQTFQRSQMIAAVELNQNLDFIAKGLNFMTLFNLTRLSSYRVFRQFQPYWYMLDRYDSYTGEYHVLRLNDTGTDWLTYTPGSRAITNSMYSESRLNYVQSFGRSDVTGLLVLTAREQQDAIAESLQLSMPSRNAGLSGRFTYGWDKRYFGEFNFGYNGSERFSRTHRWGFFPSVGLAWVVSNEPFFKPLEKVVSNLKFRASYGLVGNDNIGSAYNRFYYLSEMSMNNGNYAAYFGEGGRYKAGDGISVSRYANDAISWEKSYKSNFAVELGLFDKVNLIAEYFTEDRKDIFMNRADIPQTMGLQATIAANIGEAVAHGIDVQADYKQAWSNGMWASARANFTYSVGKYEIYEEPKYPEAYRQRAGQAITQVWGYLAERLFIDDEDAANSPSQITFGSKYGGGDIKYTDVNGDGMITTADRVPIGYPASPEIVYGFGTSFGFKGFDFSMFFQGLARESFWMNVTNDFDLKRNRFGMAPFVNNTQLLKAFSDSHWSEDNRNIYALYPRYSAYHNKNNTVTSTWWMRDGSFLRFKQLELGYTMPQKLTTKWRIENLRVYFQGNNLWCWSKFKLWDPEMGTSGLNYPIQRTFNIGVTVTFK